MKKWQRCGSDGKSMKREKKRDFKLKIIQQTQILY